MLAVGMDCFRQTRSLRSANTNVSFKQKLPIG